LPEHEEFTDYYKVLNVERNVDDKNLYAAYSTMVKKYALPPGASAAVEHRREIEFAIYQKAFTVLSNPNERKKYDLQLELNDVKVQEERLNKNEAERRREHLKNANLQSQSPIKNDPRLKDSVGGFSLTQFKIVEIDQNKLDVVKKEREQNEKIKSEAKFAKAKQYLSQGNDDAAIDYLKELVEKYPKVAEYHSYLGLAMQTKGWTGYSQAEFKVALHFNPKDEIALKYYQNPDSPAKQAAKPQAKPEEKKGGFFSKLFGKK
jgi:tetratricopeptide (TPR) repeat protein